MQPSPYTPGELARTVPGRQEQLDQIRAVLASVERFGRLAGRIRVDVGPRGLGKTSLLREAERQARRLGLATVFVTAGNGPMLPELAEGVARAVEGSAPGVLAGLITEVKAKIGIGLASLEATVKQPPGSAPGATAAFRDLVARAASLARHGDRRGLVVFLDEFQSTDAASMRTLAYAWQELQALADEVPAAVFAAGLSHTHDVVTDAVTFGERFAFRRLRPLDDPAVREALTGPAAELGVTWRTDVLSAVLERAQGYPYFVQLYGEAMWLAAASPDPGGQLRLDHLQQAQRAVEVDLISLFRGRWAKATPREREVMAAMASVGDSEVKRSTIAARLGVPTTDLSMVRQALIDKGLVDAPKHGYLAFTIPGFAGYVRGVIDG